MISSRSRGPRSVLQSTPQRRAVDVVHHDERDRAVLLERIEADDVGVIESGQRFALPAKAPDEVRVFCEIFG